MTSRLPLVVGPGNVRSELASTDTLLVPARLRRPNHIFPAISSNQNDWNPTDLATASTITITATGARDITGLTAGAVGDEVTLRVDFTSDDVTLKARDNNSASANWLVMRDHVVLQPYMSMSFRYADLGGGQFGWVPISDLIDTTAFSEKPTPIRARFDGAGALLIGTVNGDAAWLPYDFTISSWHLSGDGSVGSGTVDVQVSSDLISWTSITASATPACSSARANSNSTLTGWTVTHTGGVYMRGVGSGWAAWKSATLELTVTKQ